MKTPLSAISITKTKICSNGTHLILLHIYEADTITLSVGC